MVASAGHITNVRDAAPERADGDTAEVRTTIDGSVGCERLVQRVIHFGAGRSHERENGNRQEVLYVASGRGTLHLGADEHALVPDTGVFIAPGERYSVENQGPDELELVSVTAPASAGGVGANRRVTVRYA